MKPLPGRLSAEGVLAKPKYIKARLKLVCEIKNGLIYFQNTPVRPNALLRFKFGRQTVVGSVIGERPGLIRVNYHVFLSRVKEEQLSELQTGRYLLSAITQSPAAKVNRILNSERIFYPVSPQNMEEVGEVERYYQVLLSAEFYCEPGAGGLVSEHQGVAHCSNYKFALNGGELTGILLESGKPSFPLNILFPWVPAEITSYLKPGMLVYNPQNESELARVESILALDTLLYVDRGPGIDPGRKYCRALLRLELLKEPRNGVLIYNGEPLDYGTQLTFRFHSVDLAGSLWYGDRLPTQREPGWKNVEVEFRNVSPLVAANIRSGETERVENAPVSWVIEEVLSDKPAQMVNIAADGTFTVSEHPLNRDIRCRVRLRVSKAGETFYYKESRLILGTRIAFVGERWSFPGFVVDY
ncbi:MAG: hypothetical protein DRG82_17215 [Deltaproteobacteria bacterium]|nr:MAG: hypothetical protein DRG82_17215 [Deltaproteobacteria bacterium]